MNFTPLTVEAEVVARLARGDSQKQIASDLNLNPNTVTSIKKRQSHALSVINTKVAQRKQLITVRLLEKAHKQLEKRLNESDNYESLLNEIELEYETSDKNKEDIANYRSKRANLAKLSTGELVAITKEMFHQSQVEQGKPTNLISSGDQQATKQQLEDLLEALRNGDEVKMLQMTINPNEIGGEDA